MNMKIVKKNIENIVLKPYKDKVNNALDYLWETPWVKNSITKSDRGDIEAIQDLAKSIQGQSDLLLVLASDTMARMIKALSDAVPEKEGMPEVIVFGDTFSTMEYAQLFNKLEGKDYSILAVSEGEESVALRGAYVCLKRHLVGRYGAGKAADRLYAIAGKESQLIAKDAAENEIVMLPYPQEMTAAYGANTNAAKLILAVKDVSLIEYLDGFYEMLASPMWDLDGADYSIARAIYKKEGGLKENLWIWQKELAAFGQLQEAVDVGLARQVLYMPCDSCKIEEKAIDTQLTFEKGEEDLMMPFFEGCNPDGSLNLLLRDTAEKYFFENNDENVKVCMSVEALNSNNLGQIFAFFQISNGITEFLLKN